MTISTREPARTRKDLGARLRSIRLRAGITSKALAGELECHPSKVSRIEHGTVAAAIADIRKWCVVCMAEDETDDLIAEAVEAERIYTQWRAEGLRRTQAETTDLFQRSTKFRIYESRVIPGVLQTADYAGRILSVIAEFRGTGDDVAALVAVRQAHQSILKQAGKTFAFLIEEFVFRAPFADQGIMNAQLHRLLADMELPAVSVGIIPLDHQRHWWPMESFYLYDDGPVRVQLIAGRWSMPAPGDVAEYARTFQGLGGSAVYGEEARQIIQGYIRN